MSQRILEELCSPITVVGFFSDDRPQLGLVVSVLFKEAGVRI